MKSTKLKRRTYPHGEKEYCALESDFWAENLDLSQKVAVYWCDSASSVTVVGYYDTVSDANTAATAAAKANGAKPTVAINWDHSDISHISHGPVEHPDAREDLPAWIDAEPSS